MREATVQLVCPECAKDWQTTPDDLPASGRTFHCPNCHASRRLSEFMRTQYDLETLQQLRG